jgi:hypothetical protein
MLISSVFVPMNTYRDLASKPPGQPLAKPQQLFAVGGGKRKKKKARNDKETIT